MKQFRSQLTRLKGLISEKLPADQDVFGFSGVSKDLLIAAVDVAYALSRDIEDKDDGSHFEIVALKRAGSKVYDGLKFLENLNTEGPDRDKFDRFLTGLSDLIEKTKLVYLVINKEGIRDDVELQTIKGKITTLSAELSALTEVMSEYSQKADEAKINLDEIKLATTEASEMLTELNVHHTKGCAQAVKIEELHDKVIEWEDEFAKRSAEIRLIDDQMKALQKASSQLKQDFETSVKAGVEGVTLLDRLSTDNRKLQEEIHQTLGDANRVGMAGSFKERKADIDKSLLWWRATFIVTLPVIAGLAWSLLTMDNSQTVNWSNLVVRLGVISPLIWLGWFAAKQFSYQSRISEDYAFKYAASMAYEGFKKATRETDEALERVLLEFSLFNMAQNPIRLYNSKPDHASPANEMLDTVLGGLKHMKKVTLELPKIGKLTAETKGKNDAANEESE